MAAAIFIVGLLAAADAGRSGRLAQTSPAIDPVLAKPRLIRPHPVTRFRAPMPAVDLRTPPADLPALTATLATSPAFAVVREPAARRVPSSVALVSAPPDYRLASQRPKSGGMVAGVRMRMVAAGGILVPTLSLAGTGGWVASRIAVEAMGLD